MCSLLTKCVVIALATIASTASEAACVWKVTGPKGGTLYLGGSIHALRSVDYPLPAAYNRAFDASSRIIFEVDHKAMGDSDPLDKVGRYPGNDSLKIHVDPRTYNDLKRLFALLHVPEAKFATYKSGILYRQTTGGLESVREHVEVFAGLSNRQAETLLLTTLIPHAESKGGDSQLMTAWRRGDADAVDLLADQNQHTRDKRQDAE